MTIPSSLDTGYPMLHCFVPPAQHNWAVKIDVEVYVNPFPPLNPRFPRYYDAPRPVTPRYLDIPKVMPVQPRYHGTSRRVPWHNRKSDPRWKPLDDIDECLVHPEIPVGVRPATDINECLVFPEIPVGSQPARAANDVPSGGASVACDPNSINTPTANVEEQAEEQAEKQATPRCDGTNCTTGDGDGSVDEVSEIISNVFLDEVHTSQYTEEPSEADVAAWLNLAKSRVSEMQEFVTSVKVFKQERQTCVTLAMTARECAEVCRLHGDLNLSSDLIDGALILLEDARRYISSHFSEGSIFVGGIIEGFTGIPVPVDGGGRSFNAGKILGASLGMAVDGAAIVSGLLTISGTGAVVATSCGVLALPAAGVAAVATTALATGALDAQGNWERLRKAQNMFNESTSQGTGDNGSSTGGSSARNPVTHEKYKRQLRQVMGKPKTTDLQLSEYMNELWRPGAEVGNGSTMAAVRLERLTSQTVKGRLHHVKAQSFARALEKWLRNHPGASAADRAAAENVLADLVDALGGIVD